MGIVTVPTFGADPVTITGPSLDAKVDGLATEFNGNIDNDNIDSAAAIANSKLNLASISQNVSFAGTVALTGVNTISGVTSMSGKIFKLAKGADVASVAGAITLGDDGNYFDITGTEAITSITAKTAGTVVVLQFDSTASLVDGSNLKIAGNFQGAAESQIALSCDGTNWFEISRSPAPTFTPSVTNALSGSVIAHSYASTASVVTCSTAIPYDNSIPQKTEGNEVITVSHTPSNSSNILVIRCGASYGGGSSVHVTGSLLQDSTSDALTAREGSYNGTNEGGVVELTWKMAAGTTSSTTFKFNVGPSSSTVYVNGDASGTRLYGGVSVAYIEVTEYKA